MRAPEVAERQSRIGTMVEAVGIEPTSEERTSPGATSVVGCQFLAAGSVTDNVAGRQFVCFPFLLRTSEVG